jgi:hypothetical protein
MNQPIDILAIAASRYHDASEGVRYAGMLNASPAASRHYEAAIAAWRLADADRARAQWLMLELSRPEATP